MGLALLLLGGCATAPESKDRDQTVTAAGIYQAGERAFAAGRPDQAVRLWRHALLQLPPTRASDHLRHQLVLRIAYGQVVAHAATGRRGYLDDARTMLLRYVDKHQALFGEGEKPARERGEVYELLHVVETRLEEAPAPAVESASPSRGRDPEDGDASPAVVARVEPPNPTPTPGSNEPDPAPPTATAQHAGEVVGPENVRRVDVGPAEDPRVRQRLESDFSDAMVPVVYLPPGEIHGPRPLVRIGGPIEPTDARTTVSDGRDRGRALVAEARVALRACYDDAFSRRPVDTARPTVQARIHADGTVSHVRLVKGGLVDPLGDVCVIEELERTRLAASETTAEVRVPLLFFWQGARYFDVRSEAGALNGASGPLSLPESNPGATVGRSIQSFGNGGQLD